MPDDSKIDFDLGSIGLLVSTSRLAVPIYQRSYSWGPTQLEDFWNDLSGALAGLDAEYFLGTLVLSREGDGAAESRVSIVDGQQRIATTSILYASIRDAYKTNGDDARAEIVQNTYLSEADLETGQRIPSYDSTAKTMSIFERQLSRASHMTFLTSRTS